MRIDFAVGYALPDTAPASSGPCPSKDRVRFALDQHAADLKHVLDVPPVQGPATLAELPSQLDELLADTPYAHSL